MKLSLIAPSLSFLVAVLVLVPTAQARNTKFGNSYTFDQIESDNQARYRQQESDRAHERENKRAVESAIEDQRFQSQIDSIINFRPSRD